LRRDRSRQASPAQLRVTADLIEQGRAAAATSGGTTESGMSESTATLHRTNEPALARQGLRHAA
jgi:fatty acid/phospholipid biosynthesis enzyme